jgi:single-strand DNA-binding protein
MADLNKVFLMGRLTFDPELRRTTGGTAVTELRLATTRSWSGRDGERREETLFIGVTVWDRQAENCCQFLRKGSSVHVEGSLKMDTWDDKTTGEKRSKVLVHADRVQFLDGRRGDSGSGMGASPDDDYTAGPQAAREPSTRRGGATAPARGSAGPGETRSVANGPGRPAYQAANSSENLIGTAANDAEEDDIPF